MTVHDVDAAADDDLLDGSGNRSRNPPLFDHRFSS
jgi:hypothetical protein